MFLSFFGVCVKWNQIFCVGNLFFSSFPFPHYSDTPQRHLGFLLCPICRSAGPSFNATSSGLLQLRDTTRALAEPVLPACSSDLQWLISEKYILHHHLLTCTNANITTQQFPEHSLSQRALSIFILPYFITKKKKFQASSTKWISCPASEAQGLKYFVPLATLDGQDFMWTFINLFTHSFSKYYGHIEYSGTG